MSFWTLTDGQQATGEVTVTNLDALPKGWYTAMFEEVANKEWEDDRYINIKARIVTGEYANRVVFLKLKVYETNSQYYKAEARDKAIQKLVKLYQILKVKLPNGEPDDRSLSQLADKPLDIMLDVWKDNDTKEVKGNWLANLAAKGEEVKAGGKTSPSRNAPPADDPRFADAPF